MRFIIFVIDNENNLANGNEMEQIDLFNEMLQANNHWIYAAGLGAPKSAKLIDNREDNDLLLLQSLFDSKDYYSGFWLIEAPDEGSAILLAKAGSKACNRRVELRPFL
jgi:hypothetical protein